MTTTLNTQITEYNYQAGDRTFKVQGGSAQYVYRTLDAELADDFGCRGANAIIVGRHGYIIGAAVPVTGKAVRVAGWPGWKRGVLSTFTYGGETLKGWVSE